LVKASVLPTAFSFIFSPFLLLLLLFCLDVDEGDPADVVGMITGSRAFLEDALVSALGSLVFPFDCRAAREASLDWTSV